MLAAEEAQKWSKAFQAIVAEWPIERIAGLENRCKLPRSRIVALLGVGMSAYSSLCAGRYTPSPALCRRMAQLEEMADRGELHGSYVPAKAEMQRRMCLFRAWWFARDPTKDFPLVEVVIRVKWGRDRRHEIIVPVDTLPQLRLTKWEGLTQVIRAVVMALRGVARVTAREQWKAADASFWERYARDTLPQIVMDRAAREVKGMLEARGKRRI